MVAHLVSYELAHAAFEGGHVDGATDAELREWLLGLANQPVRNETTQHRDIIRGLTINNLIMQRHIDKLDGQNRLTQWLVIALTVVATITGVVQTYFSYIAYRSSVPNMSVAPQHTRPLPQLPSPTPAKPQAADPAKR